MKLLPAHCSPAVQEPGDRHGPPGAAGTSHRASSLPSALPGAQFPAMGPGRRQRACPAAHPALCIHFACPAAFCMAGGGAQASKEMVLNASPAPMWQLSHHRAKPCPGGLACPTAPCCQVRAQLGRASVQCAVSPGHSGVTCEFGAILKAHLCPHILHKPS